MNNSDINKSSGDNKEKDTSPSSKNWKFSMEHLSPLEKNKVHAYFDLLEEAKMFSFYICTSEMLDGRRLGYCEFTKVTTQALLHEAIGDIIKFDVAGEKRDYYVETLDKISKEHNAPLVKRNSKGERLLEMAENLKQRQIPFVLVDDKKLYQMSGEGPLGSSESRVVKEMSDDISSSSSQEEKEVKSSSCCQQQTAEVVTLTNSASNISLLDSHIGESHQTH